MRPSVLAFLLFLPLGCDPKPGEPENTADVGASDLESARDASDDTSPVSDAKSLDAPTLAPDTK